MAALTTGTIQRMKDEKRVNKIATEFEQKKAPPIQVKHSSFPSLGKETGGSEVPKDKLSKRKSEATKNNNKPKRDETTSTAVVPNEVMTKKKSQKSVITELKLHTSKVNVPGSPGTGLNKSTGQGGKYWQFKPKEHNYDYIDEKSIENDSERVDKVPTRISSDDGRRNTLREDTAEEDIYEQVGGRTNKEDNAENGACIYTDENPVDIRVSTIQPDYITKNWNCVKLRPPTPKSERPTTSFYIELSKNMDVMITKDESNFENVSIKYRPMVVAELYGTLTSTEWLNAKEEIDKKLKWSENERHRLLCAVFEIALNVAQQMKSHLDSRVTDYLTSVLSQPFVTLSDKDIKHSSYGPEAKQMESMLVSMGDYLRLNLKTVDVGPLQKRVTDIFQERIKNGFPSQEGCDLLSEKNHDVHEYIKAVSGLCWMMVIQRPQMTFNQDGHNKGFDPSTQQAHWESSDPESSKSRVVLHVYPAMFHAGKLMVKGLVKLEETD